MPIRWPGGIIRRLAEARHLLPTLALIGLVLLIWAPFGWKTLGLVEEWEAIQLADMGASIYWTDATPALAIHRLRPLSFLPFYLAYILSPDSSFGFNILIVAILAAKGVVALRGAIWFRGARH